MSEHEGTSSQAALAEIRTRTLTEKAHVNFIKQCEKHSNNLIKYRRNIEEVISSFRNCDKNKCLVEDLKNKLNQCFKDYEVIMQNYSDFLTNTRTEESTSELESQRVIHRTVAEDTIVALNEMEMILKGASPSVKSIFSSVKSVRSSSSKSVLLEQIAKTEEARTRLEYEKREAELKKEKARIEEEQIKLKAVADRKKRELEADLEVLAKERTVNIEQAVLKTYKEELEQECNLSVISSKKYVDVKPRQPTNTAFNFVNTTQPHSVRVDDQLVHNRYSTCDMNPVPEVKQNQPMNQVVSNQYSDLSKFLLKKDLLMDRFYQFDDKPETFHIWKTSFLSITSELNTSPAEEFDLLLKYLGPESRRYAVSLRSSNANNLNNGLKCLWERLYERYGSPEMVESALKKKLNDFPKLNNRDNIRLFDLVDILYEINSIKQDEKYCLLLSYFDSSTGVLPIVNKLPMHLQSKWMLRATNYKKCHNVHFPPFSEFCNFVKEMSSMLNDPGLSVNVESKYEKKFVNKASSMVRVQKTMVFIADTCPVHGNAKSHTLNNCKVFLRKSVSERKRFLRDNKICYKCCNSTEHIYSNCPSSIQCAECGSERHPTALHFFKSPSRNYGRESSQSDNEDTVLTNCTNICGKGFMGKSCSKIVLVKVYPEGQSHKAKTVYCIIDDQSNRTLCSPNIFDLLNVRPHITENYTLVSCSGSYSTQGRIMKNLIVSSLDGRFNVKLSKILECAQLPDTRSEIPSPEVTYYHNHLRDIQIPPIDPNSDILLLIGRDVPDVHHVLEQRIGPRNSPFGQKLGLGWVIIGEVCLGNTHVNSNVNVLKTYVLNSGRSTIFPPCNSKIQVDQADIDTDVFSETRYDNKRGLSLEDKEFLEIMEDNFCKDETGKWSAPLPFRIPRDRLPDNRQVAYHRAKLLETSLKNNSLKLSHFIEFMNNIIVKGYAEIAPALQEEEECWYLPLFGVYHPKKKDKIRVVFDSSSKFQGVSLNSVLLTGPDLSNNLTGILMRFRQKPVAVTGDIEQMFYQFRVNEKHRNFLRFFWYKDNDFSKELIEYRMCVHVFGNSASPAVATYGLRKIAENASSFCDQSVIEFVNNDFYVDDGITSLSTNDEAVNLLKGTQKVLMEQGNIRFHKFASNSIEVLKSFQEEDLAKDLKQTEFMFNDLPVQRSLGLCWDLNEDCFIFQTSADRSRTHTKRSVLSTINSLYDPLGFLSPFIIGGKLILREITGTLNGWDEPLPENLRKKWDLWVESLRDLLSLKIPRTYFPYRITYDSNYTLHIFCDASNKAIASVAFLEKIVNGNSYIGYVFGKSKVAPKHALTIPRLELCSAVLAVQIAETVSEELLMSPDKIQYYSDSKVVLGYLSNKTRRFYVYVENRVSRILKFSKSTQWRYVESDSNPADCGTRGLKPSEIERCPWLTGNSFITRHISREYFPLQNPDLDTEIRPITISLKTVVKLGIDRFGKFSCWKRLTVAISVLVNFVRRFKRHSSCNNMSYKTERSKTQAQMFIIGQVQQEFFSKEITCLMMNKALPNDSSVLSLSPYLDENKLLRIGGRLRNSQLPIGEKHPLLIPGRSHVALLLVRYYHDLVCHQGRHITEGAIRSAGFWITGGKRLIANVIHKCIVCRKLRGKFSEQKMSDLPVERLTPAVPFTFVGVDVFGPWHVVTRRTRGGVAANRRWAVLFTCLTIRAVHIEIIEEMSSSAFINALRRFIAIRGKVKVFRSDCGTNFVGASDNLNMNVINVDDKNMKSYLYDSGSTWIFNPPHASHMGGVWERMIGITRRILDAVLLEHKNRRLTHDVLCTFMAEISAIINSRPIVPVSSDPDNPFVLSPSMLLNRKTDNDSVDLFQHNHMDVKDIYKSQWKCVQVMAEMFWKRWKSEYLSSLQSRQLWKSKTENLKEGDVVLMKDKSVHRNYWPVGILTNIYKSDDGLVRKAKIKVIKDGKSFFYIRPVTEFVLLLE